MRTDPLIYRFYEILGVYVDTLREIIHEKFGDGIMGARDRKPGAGEVSN